MDWHTLLTRERLGKPAPSSAELGRSPFHKDHDRIIFSGAFRRLGRKTQAVSYTHLDVYKRQHLGLRYLKGLPRPVWLRRAPNAQTHPGVLQSLSLIHI